MFVGSHGLSISELCRRMKMDERTARAELEYMVQEGELDRVRPTGYHGEDRDFFAPCSDQQHPWDD
jgi:DeoR/GlpR family transcriptional regulator of sugar metabolism